MTALFRLYALGVTVTAALIACACIPSIVGAPAYLTALGVAGIAYLFAIRELARTPKYPRSAILLCLAMAAVARIPFLIARPGPQDDILRYVWDGRAQRFGYNPYTTIPADPAVAKLHTAETRGINNPDLPSLYPAGAQLFFRTVTAIHESAFAFKLAFAACDAAIVLVLLLGLRNLGRGEHWVLAYAWHPLVITSVFYNGHVDIVGILLLLISAVALHRQHRAIAAAAFGMAVAVKLLPAVLAPLYWRRVGIRDGLLAAAVFGFLYAPFLRAGAVPLGSLGVFVQRFRFNDPVFAGVERGAGLEVAAAVAVLAGVLTAAWIRIKRPSHWSNWAWPLAVSLACGPVVYPWYLVWLVPFLCADTALPLIVWTLTVLSVYFVWYANTLGEPWRVPAWILAAEYVPALICGPLVWLRGRSRQKPRQPA